ncbi:SDR family NAD(P)-dependent oxidoreductase [Scatolibacter rhodanostii]|uniref:SDR family NAD(P)-dependent oxidoreductase n=1 Tax=Scatolibacter rhodanostii TaxID=2014781 RepID=UPI000C07AD53|nr:SDR family oxidoreductase [Scatolibacter rhodanostii]
MIAEDSWLDLKGKVAVVTGAVGGMGQKITEELAKQGVNVALVDIQMDRTESYAKEISEKYPVETIAVSCDTANEDNVKSAVQTVVDKFDRVDILINTAAILRSSLFEDLSLADWKKTLDINLTGYFLMSQHFGRVMIKQGKGTLIHISTMLSKFPETYSGAYSVSKAGVNMLSKQMAAEWGQYGIRSNCILPSLVQTPLSKDFYADPEVLKERERVTASKRIGTLDDIANAVLYLASDRSEYTNGGELTVEGGLGIMMGDQIAKPGGRREYALKHK